MGPEQRRHVRKALKVRFVGSDGELSFNGADLSEGGSFLATDLLLDQGDRLQLSFQVPGVPKPMRCAAVVAWVRRVSDRLRPGGMGIEFSAMSDDDRRMLAEYLGSA
jgi:uncharacterized protein (TIGR02266 family)